MKGDVNLGQNLKAWLRAQWIRGKTQCFTGEAETLFRVMSLFKTGFRRVRTTQNYLVSP